MELVPRDELIGNVIQVIADDVWLRTDPQNTIAGALDQRGFPAGRNRPKRIPGMAGNQTELRGLSPKLALDIGVSLSRRLMMLDAVRVCPRSYCFPAKLS